MHFDGRGVGFAVVAVTCCPSPARRQRHSRQRRKGAAADAAPAAAPASTYRAPRTPDGKPNLNGIWQATNEANYDLQPHMAQAGDGSCAPGPVRAGPGRAGARTWARSARCRPAWASSRATRFPTSPRRSRRRRRTRTTGSTMDPEIKCYLPGVPRANYMPYPFQIFQSASAVFIAYEYAGAVRNIYLKDPGPPPVDSWMGQSVGALGRRDARRRRQGVQRRELVRSRGQFPQRAAARHRALHADRARRHQLRSDD